MSNRAITIKTFSGYKNEFVIYPNYTYNDLINLIERDMNLSMDKTIGLIYEGKTLTSSNFDNVLHGSVILATIRNKSTTLMDIPVASQSIPIAPQSIPIAPQSIPIAQQSIPIVSSNSLSDPKYSYKQCQALLVVFLDFVRSNSQLRSLYETNYQQLVFEITKNPLLENIIKNMLSQSGQIIKAMESGSAISININGDSGAVDEIKLTVEDEANIALLREMGFGPEVVKTYIECNKDIEETCRKMIKS